MTRIAVTGSVAFDTIMVFPGRFGDHILPEKTHLINLSFLVDRLDRRRGGTAANIAYTLALLGEAPLLCAAVGHDFADFGETLRAAGVDTGCVLCCDDLTTATCYITTDRDNNQITAFHPGAMSRAGSIDLRTMSPRPDIVVVSPDDPAAMGTHVDQALEVGARLVFAPAQQVPSMADEVLRRGLEAAWLVVGNDYEIDLIASRTGVTVGDMAGRGTTVAVTRGEAGSTVVDADGETRVPAAPPLAVVDPTGAGDAYVAGLVHGLAGGLSVAEAGRIGALAATYVVEQPGTETHHFTAAAFSERYRAAFGMEPALPG